MGQTRYKWPTCCLLQISCGIWYKHVLCLGRPCSDWCRRYHIIYIAWCNCMMWVAITFSDEPRVSRGSIGHLDLMPRSHCLQSFTTVSDGVSNENCISTCPASLISMATITKTCEQLCVMKIHSDGSKLYKKVNLVLSWYVANLSNYCTIASDAIAPFNGNSNM